MHTATWIHRFTLTIITLGLIICTAQAQSIPLMIPFSGNVDAGGTPFNGNGQFKFTITNGDSECDKSPNPPCQIFWLSSTDSEPNGEPDNAVTIPVTNGLFNVKLGDTNLTSMDTLPTTIFGNNGTTYLRVWFSDGIGPSERLTPDRQLVSVPYAYKAEEAGSVPELKTSGTINDPANPVDWTQLKNVPEDFADNTDDTGGTTIETDPTVVASVKDGVSWSEILGKPPGFADNLDNTGITSETDPQVGALTTGNVPKWDGEALVSSRIQEKSGSDTEIGGRLIVNWVTPNNNINPVVVFKTSGTFSSAGAIGLQNTQNNTFNLGITRGNKFAIAYNNNISFTKDIFSLDESGNLRIGIGTGGCLTDGDGTVLAGTCVSDILLKKDIQPFHNTLDRLIQLQPVHFKWRVDEYPEFSFGTSTSFGLIAQNVEEVFPELVTKGKNGFKAVRYNKLPMIMLQAIKEQQQEIEELKEMVLRLSQKAVSPELDENLVSFKSSK